ncbi:ABC transporter substrate-binding protein [Corynebacterium tapiri]|uniref:Extracellular solute-binding protein n=1 Tax=Corynebacterium tapiri TaxID=1448266 RepID=A0A5C4U2P4_9CORY|nr:extracellular solute-binding protein [Corynebacterium tapiri]TNL95595.1 extracellular solute-binding protein [Corynebacterium tapiri]
MHRREALPPLSRRTFLAASAALLATPLASCARGNTTTTDIRFYQSKPEAIPYFTDLASEFNKSQNTFHVTHDTATNLSASFVRDNPPDLGCLNYNLEMGRFMERGALTDLADLPEADRIRDDVKELATAYATYEGRTSVLPYSVTASSVIYNRDIFDQHGLEVPETWDEFINLCETLKSKDVLPIYSTFLDPWTITQGLFDYTVGGLVDVKDFYDKMKVIGKDVGPDSEVSFQNTLREPVQRMMQLIEYTNRDATSRAYGDGNSAFADGASAMYFQGPWALAQLDVIDPNLNLGTFPLPMTDNPADRKVRVNIDLSLWIPEKADAIPGAREFLKFLMRPENQNAYNEAFLAFGTTKDAPKAADPRIADMQRYYDEARYYMGASQFIPKSIPAENYIQAIATGADQESVLARLDADWARFAFRA